jgi:acetylglutamate kinase
MHQGRRITDAETLELTTMVYAGLINKSIVAKLQAAGCASVGLSGADGPVITAEKRPAAPFDYGFAGDIRTVNTDLLTLLLHNSLAPVLCSVTADRNGQLLNTNADTIAAETAMALAKSYLPELHFLGERPGVLLDIRDDTSVIPEIGPVRYEHMKAENLVHEGMLPKLDNAFRAANNGVDRVYITHFSRLPDHTSGTRVVRSEE